MMKAKTIQLKRAYEKPETADGKRILVERLWPRGVSKSDAAIDCWLKEIAPSTELRKWYNHQIGRWEDFQVKYKAELVQKTDVVSQLYDLCQGNKVTFIYAARDEEHNSALVLKDFLLNNDKKST
jgi:uncharacterized protein YeaO (DUF488 family)